MTLTPAQVVAIDALREAFDEATVRAMLAGPMLLDALCAVALEQGRDIDIDERDLFALMDGALWSAHACGVFESQFAGAEALAREENRRRNLPLVTLRD